MLLEHKAKVDHPSLDGCRPLLIASLNGYCNVVALLLEAGADVNAADGKGRTALMAGAHNSQLDVVKLLVDWGVEIDQGTHNGYTALMQASSLGHCDVVKLLLENKANTELSSITGTTALINACINGHYDVVTLLLGAKADVNAAFEEGWTALMAAAHIGHTDVVKLLIAHGAEIDKCNVSGRTALMQASKNGHLDVTLLLQPGADVNATDCGGWTALMLAAHGGQCNVVKSLIACGAKIDQGNLASGTPLMQASGNGHYDAVKALLQAGADANVANGKREGPLMAAAHGGYCDVVKLLLEHKAKTDQSDIEGNTPLMEASRMGQFGAVAILIAAGANVNADHHNVNVSTPLTKASMGGHSDVVKLLLKAGADVNAGKLEYWSRCFIKAKIIYVEKEDDDAECTELSDEGSTPLIVACASCHWEVAKVLLDAGADVVHTNKIGENALMYINQALLPVVCIQQKHSMGMLQRKISAQTCSHLLDVSPFGTTPLSDLLMASLVCNLPVSHEILSQDNIPGKAIDGYLYGLLPDRFFNSMKSVGSAVLAPFSGIEGKIALHTVGTALACKAPIQMVIVTTSRLTNMLLQTPLHLLATENHYIARSLMVDRISAMVQQGYSFSDCDINGRTCYHIAVIYQNAQFLICSNSLDTDIIHNMNIRDNVAQRAIDYIVQYWTKTPSSLVALCSSIIGKSILQSLGEDSHTPMTIETECMASIQSTWYTRVLTSHFGHDMSVEKLISVKQIFAESAFDNSKTRQIFHDRTTGVVRLEEKNREKCIITVLGLLHCIGLEMEKYDELFKCMPVLKGSILEQTKCGTLDEQDLSMKLVNFTKQFTLELAESKYVGLQGRVEKKPNCSMQFNFHSVQFCCKFWLQFLDAIRGDSVKEFLCKNSITIDSCHRKHGFTGTIFVTCKGFDHISGRPSEPICIAVDVAPAIQIKDYLCLLHVRHYDNAQVGHVFPTRLELSSSQKDWNLIRYIPQEILYGYTMIKLLRSLPKTFQKADISQRTFTADVILPSYMVKSSLLWLLDPDDKFREEYKGIGMGDIFEIENTSAYRNDVLYLCRCLIDHSISCNVADIKYNVSCLSVDDVTQLQQIADKCTGSHLHLSGRDRILPYVLMTQRNAAHHCVQNGINEDQLMEKVYLRLATQGIPQLNTEDEVIYNRKYYSESDVIVDKDLTNNGGC